MVALALALSIMGTATVCCAQKLPAPSHKLIISEIMMDPASVSDSLGEYIELYNPHSSAISIKGWTIKDQPSSYQNVHKISADVVVQPGRFVVLAVSEAYAPGRKADYVYGGKFQLANSGDEVILYDSGDGLVDEVHYMSGWPRSRGKSIELKDVKADNMKKESWCVSTKPLDGRGDMGTPGYRNSCGNFGKSSDGEPPVTTTTTAKPVGPIPSHKLIISEIMMDPASVSDSLGEYIELYNPHSSAISIKGWTIKDQPSSYQNVHKISADVVVQPDRFVVLAVSEAYAPGRKADYVYGVKFQLANSGDEVILYDSGDGLVDEVHYMSGWPRSRGKSIELKDVKADNMKKESWCVSTKPLDGRGDMGTPGYRNSCGNFGKSSVVTTKKPSTTATTTTEERTKPPSTTPTTTATTTTEKRTKPSSTAPTTTATTTTTRKVGSTSTTGTSTKSTLTTSGTSKMTSTTPFRGHLRHADSL